MFRKSAFAQNRWYPDWHSLNERVPYPFVWVRLLIPFALSAKAQGCAVILRIGWENVNMYSGRFAEMIGELSS